MTYQILQIKIYAKNLFNRHGNKMAAECKQIEICSSKINKFEDITYNLSNLQFEADLSQEEKQFIYLRKQCHALSAVACTQATYLVLQLHDAWWEI